MSKTSVTNTKPPKDNGISTAETTQIIITEEWFQPAQHLKQNKTSTVYKKTR